MSNLSSESKKGYEVQYESEKKKKSSSYRQNCGQIQDKFLS